MYKHTYYLIPSFILSGNKSLPLCPYLEVSFLPQMPITFYLFLSLLLLLCYTYCLH